MLRRAARTLWALPAAADPPARVWRDWALVGAFALAVVLEAIFRTDLTWRVPVLLVALAVVPTLLWRRTRPLAAVAVAFGAVTVLDVAAIAAGVDGALGLDATVLVLVLPYALLRWGSGRAAVLGSIVILVAAVVGLSQDHTTTLGDAIGGFVVLTLAGTFGVCVRLASTAQHRTRQEVRMREREQLARELHDTVAHHVSGIVVRAQAGRVVAETRPDAALEALAVIEDEGTRTLTELRTLVSALRERGDADLAPAPGLADLQRLARRSDGQPPIEVTVSGPLDDLRPSVETAIYRITQESVTNAVRHARHATLVRVEVVGDGDWVRVTVRDDGDPTPVDRAVGGYGVVGMSERAALLGGTLEAGPEPGRGWTVRAVLPRTAAAAR